MQALRAILFIIIVSQSLATNIYAPSNTGGVMVHSNPNFNVYQRIIGGVEASPGEFPSVVGLLIALRDQPSRGCTGTMLNQLFVLTAGHCIYPADDIAIYFNCVDLNNCTTKRNGRAILYPLYIVRKSIGFNDVGLVRSSTPMSTSGYVNLVPPRHYYPQCTVVGFGQVSTDGKDFNSKLFKLEIFKMIPCSTVFPQDPLRRHMLCSFASEDRMFYLGDSGGPLFCGEYQVGVTSHFVHAKLLTGENVTLMVWENVARFSNWIPATTSACRQSTAAILVILALYLHQYLK